MRSNISILPILKNKGPYTDSEYDFKFGSSQITNSKILVIGAGGLGCEILKNLVLSQFTQIECIDMDIIDLSNLNRQFLFRDKDIGNSKSKVATTYINTKFKTNITGHFNKIQDMSDSFYLKFDFIICGLDNIQAREWINLKLIQLSHLKIIPWIDGGTEGFQGSVKLIIPSVNACFKCYSKLLPPKTTYPLCTLATTPRLPEHCIEYALQLQWPKLNPNKQFNADDSEMLEELYQMSLKRSDEFGIKGVTKSLTLGVVKNIIPSIASTNAIISSICVNEAFKFITCVSPTMNGENLYYNGSIGLNLFVDKYDKLENCEHCSDNELIELEIKENEMLNDFTERLIKELELINCVIMTIDGDDLYNDKLKKYYIDQTTLVKQFDKLLIISKNLEKAKIVRIKLPN